jgi:hypothetical protein
MYVNRVARKASAVPRHNEINDYLARKFAEISTCRRLRPFDASGSCHGEGLWVWRRAATQ